VVLACFSSDTFSADHTGSILWKLLHLAYPGISPHSFQQIHFFVRKSAHFLSYGTLSWFAFYGFRGIQTEAAAWKARWCGMALLLTLAAASLDEFHQTFVPSRTSSPRDVLLDMAGAVVFQLVIAMIFHWRHNRRRGL
jgi:VanZ family protein